MARFLIINIFIIDQNPKQKEEAAALTCERKKNLNLSDLPLTLVKTAVLGKILQVTSPPSVMNAPGAHVSVLLGPALMGGLNK